ncbi:MAG: outer membrane protein assembly factor BamD [Candidatus Hatepunaea meridiana]|nr:outer membrane protein assembly factor BamD [Candidatus Hatepunaea meridiana]
MNIRKNTVLSTLHQVLTPDATSRNIRLLITVLLFITFVIGCSKRVPLEELNAEDGFRYIKSQYDKGKYREAVSGFDFYTLNYSGSSLVDSAQFLLGQSHFRLEDYLLAAYAFEQLYQRFQRSSLVPEAMYMVGVSYWELTPKYSLDQDYTIKAIEALQAFIDYYPDYKTRVANAQETIARCREKLAHKEYANGVIYLKMKEYPSAIIYFHDLIDLYYDTDWASKAAYQLGVSYSYDKRIEEAESAYRMFISKYPDHPWRPKAESALKKLHQVLTPDATQTERDEG